MYHISIHFSETSPFQTSIHQNIEFIIYRFKYNLQSTNNTRLVNSKASNIYLPNHTFPSILRFSILRYCRTTSLSSIQRWLMPRMSGSSNRGSSFAIVTRGIVTLHRERRPVRRTKGDREREGRGEGGEGDRNPRGYLHLRPLPVLLVDRLSTIRPRGWMHGAETPRGHRLPVLADPPRNSVPDEELSLSSLTRRILCPLFLVSFLVTWPVVQIRSTLATARYREW